MILHYYIFAGDLNSKLTAWRNKLNHSEGHIFKIWLVNNDI